MVSMPYPMIYEDKYIEAKIHRLEREAYISVLRAIKTRADAIPTEKESLITKLRKELRLSEKEHRYLLSRIDSDVQRKREWLQSVGPRPGMHGAVQAVQGPSPSVSASRKKQKSCKSMPPGASSMKMQYPCCPADRGLSGNPGGLANKLAERAPVDSLIGKKVGKSWPGYGSFYEAYIADYNPSKGEYALVYDMGTVNETWHWVKLSEISLEDVQWDGKELGVSHHACYAGLGHGMNRPIGRDNAPNSGRGRGLTKSQSRKDFPPSQSYVAETGPDDIRLLHTDSLIKEVERVFGSNNSDPVEIEKLKIVLKEHEQALSEAISSLGEVIKRSK